MFSRLSLSVLLFLALPAWADSVSLSLETIRHPAFEADGVSVRLDTFRRGEADIRVARLKLGQFEYRDVTLRCSDFRLDANGIECPRGQIGRAAWRRPGAAPAPAAPERPPLPFSFSYRPAEGRLELAVAGADAVAWSPLIKRLRAWKPQGQVDLHLVADRNRAQFELTVRGLRFASRDGAIAGEGMDIAVSAQAERAGEDWRWRATADWPRGELRWAPWRRQAGVRVAAQGTLSEVTLTVDQARLDVAQLGSLTAALLWDRGRGEATDWGFVTERLDLATAMREWVQPWLAGFGFPEWPTSGHARFSAEWKAGALRRFYAGLEDARLADGTGYVELTGVDAGISWEAGASTRAEVGIAAGRLGDLPLGAFSFPLEVANDEASIRNLSAPMLDGRFEIEHLRLARGATGWQAEFEGGIEGVSMPKLSRALRLPTMAGRLTARVPRIAYADDVLQLEGALGIEVFDGGIIVHKLRVIDPFSARRRFIADVTARNLELGMLTRTFAFGSIEGRFDAELRDLELQGWKPLRFDARISSSPGEYERIVSLGALKDITALGEGSGGDAVRRVPERTIGGFGYASIGFGCRLRDGVCLLEGVEREGEGEGVVLMKGSGIPSLTIIGYNRRIDWEALVARIREVIAGRPGIVIE